MKKIHHIILTGCFLLTFNFMLPHYVNAEMLERIVAIVNDDVILQSEFYQAYETAKKYDPDALETGVLEEMINRLLLLREARKFRLTALDDEQGEVKDDRVIIKEYIDIRLRGFIHVPYEDIEYYYYQNKDSFSGRDFYDVRNEIEEYLIEQEFNVKLLEYIEDLKRNAYIRIQIDTDL